MPSAIITLFRFLQNVTYFFIVHTILYPGWGPSGPQPELSFFYIRRLILDQPPARAVSTSSIASSSSSGVSITPRRYSST